MGGAEEELKTIKQEYSSLRALYRQLAEQRQAILKLENQCKSSVEKLNKKVLSLQYDPMIKHESHSELPEFRQQIDDDEVVREVKGVSEGLREVVSMLPKPTNLFLRLILGDISVTLPNREDRVVYKQSYEKFKMFHVVLMCILSLIAIFFSHSLVLGSLVHCVSVWYYFVVTLRELVLVSNGSQIKWWWLTHHYCSIVIAVLLLTWPPGECYSAFKIQFMLFSFFLSFVMGLQFRYQKAKLYRQVAMGEKHHMSISQEIKTSNMRILVACLLAVYLFQLYNGYTLLSYYWSPEIDCSHWQIPILSLLFLVVACMNCSTLTTVIYGKRRHSKKAQ